MEIKNDIVFEGDELASRWSRLWAGLIDAIIGMIISFPLMNYFGVFELIQQGKSLPLSITLKVGLIGILFFIVIHGYLLAKNGQTVGKKLLNIKIVNLNGNKPEFLPLVAKRYLPLWVVTQIPVIGQIIPTIDGLFIFRKDKRCLHDLIASTKVINIC